MSFVSMQAPRYRRCLNLLIGLCATWILGSPPASAALHTQCDLAAQYASDRSSVPLDILRAIARVETGRTVKGELHPWPWTINLRGKGAWFDTKETAIAFTYTQFRAGARDFDIGCFQINYRWHGDGFRSIEQMFDPVENALYAARFLETLFAELGSWPASVRAYHSRTPAVAQKYYGKYERVLAQLDDTVDRGLPVDRPARTGLVGRPARDLMSGAGSLVSLTTTPSASSLAFFGQ